MKPVPKLAQDTLPCPLSCSILPLFASKSRMYRTLSELRQSVDRLIQSHGEDAPIAAFLFTEDDITGSSYFYDGEHEVPEPKEEFVEIVLADLGERDWIYEQINETIDDCVMNEVKRRRATV